MPVYHFVFHSYGSWLPDRAEGYFKHNQGWKPPTQDAADQYHANMKGKTTQFNNEQQQLLINEAILAQSFQRFTLYAAASDPTHLHMVVAWTDDRDPVRVRSGIKSSLTRVLNARHGKQQWFVAKAGHHPVQDEGHLNQLVHNYLPKHTHYWYFRSDDRL